jgi:hypothetical protein
VGGSCAVTGAAIGMWIEKEKETLVRFELE